MASPLLSDREPVGGVCVRTRVYDLRINSPIHAVICNTLLFLCRVKGGAEAYPRMRCVRSASQGKPTNILLLLRFVFMVRMNGTSENEGRTELRWCLGNFFSSPLQSYISAPWTVSNPFWWSLFPLFWKSMSDVATCKKIKNLVLLYWMYIYM